MMQCVSAGHQIVALANLQPMEKGVAHYFNYDFECIRWVHVVLLIGCATQLLYSLPHLHRLNGL